MFCRGYDFFYDAHSAERRLLLVISHVYVVVLLVHNWATYILPSPYLCLQVIEFMAPFYFISRLSHKKKRLFLPG